ncbi:MAG: hypothetical protein V3U44_07060 [Alphaproteobacteria bacterium]|jgi:hypothetical protein
MTTPTISKPAEPGIWTRLWHRLRAFDEAVHDNPTQALHRRIRRMEARLDDLEAGDA